jgi:hypothetical protein
MDLLNQLLDLLSTPLGWMLVVFGLVLAQIAKPSRPRLRWLIFSVCGFLASLAEFRSEWIEAPPALAFPLQQLRMAGRPLTLVLVGILLLNILLTHQPNWRHRLLPTPILFLALVQGVIVLKTLANGSIGFALLTVTTYGAVVTMMVFGPSRWLQDERNLILALGSLAMVGVLFGLANLYQATINVYAITFVHGWFLGTTGNPHHAAVLIVAVLPCLLFFCHHKDQAVWQQRFWLGCLGLAVLGLAATASRTGMLMATTAVLAFYWRQGNRLVQLAFVVVVALLVGLSISELTGLTLDLTGVFDSALNKIEFGTDTRSGVFLSYWKSFLEYPLTGPPFTAERIRFGESAWLGVMGTLGLAGLIPMVLFGYSTMGMVMRLNTMVSEHPTSSLVCSTVMAGLIALLVGGISEAYLLGNLSFAILALFLYLAMGSFLLEVADLAASPSAPANPYQLVAGSLPAAEQP